MLTIKTASLVTLAMPLVLLAGCPNNTTDDHPGKDGDAGTSSPDADSQPVVVTPKNPIGSTCSANTDCGSGFCTDGVCCDSACDQTCYA